MITIYKYQLGVVDSQTVSMPTNAQILTVQVQNGIPCIWAAVDPDAQTQIRTFHTYGTGHAVNTSVELFYIGTYQLHGGGLVFHVWEEING